MSFNLPRFMEMLKLPTAREKFARIYSDGLWHGTQSESLSGDGSTLEATEKFRPVLESWLQSQPPQRFFDGPCGDFHFMRHVKFPEGWSYVGGDIVPAVVAKLQQEWPDKNFIAIDLAHDAFPPCDVWLCRDCLIHLSYGDIFAVLRNFLASDAQTALITTSPNTAMNGDIATGDYRPVNLTRPPFSLPQPILLEDRPNTAIGVWSRAQIAAALAAHAARATMGMG